jgi:SAM-dependent methyltransferase
MFEKLLHRVRFNLRYLGKPRWDTGVSPPELLQVIDGMKPGRALDLGCGTGTNLLTLAQRGWEVVGVEMILLPVLKSRLKLFEYRNRAKIYHGDVTRDYRFAEPFDLILDMGCFHNLSDESREIYRLNLKKRLRGDGIYLLYAHRRKANDGIHGIDQYDLDAFAKVLRLEWQKDNREHRPDGGGGRPATWACYKRGNP